MNFHDTKIFFKVNLVQSISYEKNKQSIKRKK